MAKASCTLTGDEGLKGVLTLSQVRVLRGHCSTAQQQDLSRATSLLYCVHAATERNCQSRGNSSLQWC
jgi:hypothetical protein